MVTANLEGRKTQTRRIITQQNGKCMFCGCVDDNCKGCIERTGEPCSWTNDEHTICSACADLKNISKAKYQIGDILWVRETWQYNDDLEEPYLYKQKFLEEYKAEFHNSIKWKPSIFMPKEAARIFLKIINVRIERLRDICESDAMNEGILPLLMSSMQLEQSGKLYQNYMDKSIFFNDGCKPIESFKSLWESINGKGSWIKNPFVWVYDYQLTEKP